MADYYQLKNQNIFNPPANTDMGNANSQFNTMYVQNALVLGNVSVTGNTIIAPRVTSIAYPGNDTAADTAGGQTITLTGSGFVAGASVLINGSAVGVVSVVSSTSITFTSPANTTGSYVIYVINSDGSTAIAIPGIQYSGTPSWTTAAGTLGNVYETASFNQTVTATGDAPITYSVASGSLPPGSTFNANGTITGTSQLSSSPTTYSFTVRATDAEAQDTDRAFSIAVIPDVVTWSSPTNNQTYTPAANIAIANITLSATSAVGSGITYSANTLPTGLSLTGANISGTPTVQANTSTLLTATANTTTESSSITINWVVSVASDPYFMYNSLLLPGNGTNGAQNNTFLDGSTNNFAITRYGNTTQGTFSPYGPNWSNYFDGTGDYLLAPANSAFGFDADFTVEAWINTTEFGVETFFRRLFSTGADAATAFQVLFFNGGTGVSEISVYSNTMIITGTIPVANGAWHHVAISRSGTSMKLFVDGVQSGSTATTSQNFSGGTTNGFYIGRYAGGDGGHFKGNISNVRVVKGTALYTSTFTPSTIPLTAIANTSLLTCQSNRFIDNSTNAFVIAVYGNTSVQRFSPFSPTAAYSAGTIGGSGYFDGTGDNLQLTYSSTMAAGTGPYSFEVWVYFSGSGTNQGVIGTTSDGFAGFERATGTWAYYNGISATNTLVSVVLNQWTHVVICRNGSGAGAFFVNGIRLATYTDNTTKANFGNLQIGYNGVNGGAFTTGNISDYRYVKGNPYDPTLSTLTVPTSPLTAIANTVALLNFTNAGIIDNTMINNLETVGNAQISTGQNNFGSGSMYFDGNGDYCFLPRTSSFLFSSGDFTIELWTYISDTSTRKYILGPGTDTATHYMGFGLEIWGQQLCMWASSTGSSWNMLECDNSANRGPTLMAANTWYNITVSRSNGTFRSFVNGVLEKTFVVAGTIYSDPTVPYNIGRSGYSPGNYFYYNGYMDDLRITLGYARYTSNFTPATVAFPTY